MVTGSRSAIASSCGAMPSSTRTSASCWATAAALVIDTRSTHVQAREIVDDLRELTAAPVTVVVDTHGHFDHAFGNHVFRPAPIWGHEGCVAFMARTARVAPGQDRGREPRDRRRSRRGRHRSARSDLRRDGLRRRRRTAGRAALPRPRPYRPRHRRSACRMPPSCSRATSSRTARSRSSATPIRSIGRRRRFASLSCRSASSCRATATTPDARFADEQAAAIAELAFLARRVRDRRPRRSTRRWPRRRSPTTPPRTSGSRSNAPWRSCAASFASHGPAPIAAPAERFDTHPRHTV